MKVLASALAFAGLAVAASLEHRQSPAPWSNYVKNGVFYPSQNAESWRTLYARSLQLPDKSLLLSWEDYDPTVKLTYWPVYRSTDGGVSFRELSRVEDQVNGWGNWYQPFFYELPQAVGDYPRGTILIAGASTPRNLSAAYIDIYASKDSGKTWAFVSHVVFGPGPETVRNGDKAVWEPFLMMYQGSLVCYYSTQADPNHAQKLSHKTTRDLKNWSAEVDDVAHPNYGDRPGMTTVAYSPNSRKYVMTFEYCGGPLAGGCPVYFKTAQNPLQFGSVQPLPITPNDPNGNPNGSPYVIWTNQGANGQGIFIMNGNSREEVFVNSDAVNPNGWKPVNLGHWAAYSRSLRVVTTPSNQKKLFIANGGNIGCSGSCYNYVADALVDIPAYPA
ncbi:hypothetical protein CKM354_001299900 [Cercospora kikuchii]|uniref:BNR/Asp-box repeat domain protein n=1 Tax=Cercospora kikuchii TaxID=84275 RepID=A0A9P3FN79_9PEZI|nr:uncharacterized protein CKM354_001299900 [Cercospora kikuchii]GIZ49984.1 hypothetical protein CKM354_001299900 [Cercospora kikuchii]